MSNNLKLAYWGSGGFVDLDSAFNKITKKWAYNTIIISHDSKLTTVLESI